MKILTDIHTHTTTSDHAYSTLMENVMSAKERGLELLAMTNHGPSMPDAPHIWHFMNFNALPPVIDGVKMLYGAELNINNQNGDVDLPDDILKGLGVVIASIHNPTYADSDKADHTKTWLNVMENPYINILGHIGRGNFPFNHEAVVSKAKEKDICIEVNRLTIKNENQRAVCKDIILCCKKYGTKIVVNSDSHFCLQIGQLDDAIKLLSECDFPEKLIVNRTADSLIEHLKNKNKHFNYKF